MIMSQHQLSSPIKLLIEELAAAGWQGTLEHLLAALNKMADRATRQQYNWPTTIGSLRKALNGLTRVLRAMGVMIEYGRSAQGAVFVTLHVRATHCPKCGHSLELSKPERQFEIASEIMRAYPVIFQRTPDELQLLRQKLKPGDVFVSLAIHTFRIRRFDGTVIDIDRDGSISEVE